MVFGDEQPQHVSTISIIPLFYRTNVRKITGQLYLWKSNCTTTLGLAHKGVLITPLMFAEMILAEFCEIDLDS